MEFKTMSAEQYRALDLTLLDERRDLIANLLDGDEVDLDTLEAEAALLRSEYERRNKQASIRSMQIAQVAMNGAGKVMERTAEVKPMKAAEYYDSEQYREQFMKFVQYRTNYEQIRADAIAVTGEYTSEQDYASTYEHKVAVPQTMGREIIRKLKEESNIFAKVRKMNLNGGVWFRIKDLDLEAMWINDKQVSPYQKDNDGDTISFSYFELECRFAQTMLASAVTWEDFQAMFIDAVARAMKDAIETAIIRGTGENQPLGIVVDNRVKTEGTVIEVTKEDLDDWKFWRSVPFKIPRVYRERGMWMIADSTWGLHLDMLRDSDGNPLGKYDPLNDMEPYSLMHRPVEPVMETILPAFEDAEVGEVFGIYGDLHNYVVNTQPGMPLSTVQWDDHESNQKKIKSLVALDGKVLDPYGFALLVKKASA